jgi:GxxExxY protein
VTPAELNALSKTVLDAAFRVHSTFGPGLLESAYAACLVYELKKSGLKVRTEVPVPVIYDQVKLDDVGFRIDILVENELIIEVKALSQFMWRNWCRTSNWPIVVLASY